MNAKVSLRREEGHFRARQGLAGLGAFGAHRRVAGLGQRGHRVAALEAHLVAVAVAVDLQLQPVAERVDHRDADAVQTARDLVAVLVELTAGVQLGHDDLGRRDALALVDVDGDAATVVGDRHRAVGVEDDLHLGGVTGQGLVDGVVDHLIDHVVQARAVVGVADVHAGALAHRVQALQHLDRIGVVFAAHHFGSRHLRAVGGGQAVARVVFDGGLVSSVIRLPMRSGRVR
jgi:hypothetical protein